jgi:transposase
MAFNMERELIHLKLSEIVFDEGLYPRIGGHDPALVQEYARDMLAIESAKKFIAVNAANILVDGRHRMLAYRKLHDDNGDAVLSAYRYSVTSQLETFRLANVLQDRGKALTKEDRITNAKKLYALGESNQASIGEALGVSQSTISGWLSRTLKEEKERQRDQAYARWLSCHTQQEIAESIGVTQQVVSTWTEGFTKLLALDNFVNAHDFTPPLYNVWRQRTKTDGVDHHGNSEVRWLENLLYLYTAPADIVVDPFAGGGSTIDVCKKRERRYWVSDRKPIVEREHEIRKHDLTVGLPPLPRWHDVKLVYLDPPYWKQAEGAYSDDPTDLANMPLEQFTATLAKLITDFGKKLRSGAVIALLMQPTQWKSPEHAYTDHVADMLRLIKLPLEMRISCPYESEQYTAQMVDFAKQHRMRLVLTRELIIWKIA